MHREIKFSSAISNNFLLKKILGIVPFLHMVLMCLQVPQCLSANRRSFGGNKSIVTPTC